MRLENKKHNQTTFKKYMNLYIYTMPFGNPDGFRGFQLKKTRSKKQTQLDSVKSRKSTPQASYEEVVKLIDKMNFPDDVKNELKKSAQKSLNNKQKSTISRGAAELKTRAESKRLLDKECKKYSAKTKKLALKIFNDLDDHVRYQRRFVLGLQKIGIPHKLTLEFILHNWRDIVRYISSRDVSNNKLEHFFYVSYGANPPSKVNFLQILIDVNDYSITYDN